jgi:hypothetical protein
MPAIAQRHEGTPERNPIDLAAHFDQAARPKKLD